MTTDDQAVLQELLLAVAKGPFFPDWEFPTLFGCSRSDVTEIGKQLPSDPGHLADVAIGNALNNMLRYPHGQDAAWSEWLSVSRDELEELECRWRGLQPPLRYSVIRVHGPTQIEENFYRVIEYTTERGGHGMTCQVWKGGQWFQYQDGPSGPEILRSPPSSHELLARFGVADGPLPEGYDPNAQDGL